MFLRPVVSGLLTLPLTLAVLASEPSDKIVDRLIHSYDSIERISCLVRRDTQQGKQKERVLSRVFYQKPDKIHVETLSPFKRRIISDGHTFYDVPERASKGYAKPVADLDEKRLAQLRKIPGTAMDHLFQLRGLDSSLLEGTTEHPERYAFQTKKQYIILHLDAKQRLVRIAIYNQKSDPSPRVVFDYSDFMDHGETSIPTRHRGTIQLLEGEIIEETRIQNLKINGIIPPSLFNPASYFNDLEFTDEYQDIFNL